jgi:hypothetical protein
MIVNLIGPRTRLAAGSQLARSAPLPTSPGTKHNQIHKVVTYLYFTGSRVVAPVQQIQHNLAAAIQSGIEIASQYQADSRHNAERDREEAFDPKRFEWATRSVIWRCMVLKQM